MTAPELGRIISWHGNPSKPRYTPPARAIAAPTRAAGERPSIPTPRPRGPGGGRRRR